MSARGGQPRRASDNVDDDDVFLELCPQLKVAQVQVMFKSMITELCACAVRILQPVKGWARNQVTSLSEFPETPRALA